MCNGRGHHRSSLSPAVRPACSFYKVQLQILERLYDGNEGRRGGLARGLDLSPPRDEIKEVFSQWGEISRPYGRVRGVR